MMPSGLSVALPITVSVGAAIAIAMLERARRRNLQAAVRWATISRVSAALAEVLQADTALEDVARLMLPEFADWCTLHLVDAKIVRRVAVAHVDPAIERLIRARFATVPFLFDAPRGPAKVIRTGELDLQEVVGPDSLIGQRDPALFQLAGYGSLISVPLQAPTKTIGALTLHRRAPHSYHASDVEWAQDLAHRIALALEHARLFDNARELFEQSASANWVGTPDGRILACNQMFAQLLGFESIADAMTTPALLLYEDAEEGQRFADELSARRRIAGRETTFKRHDDGRPVYALVNAVGEFDEAARLSKFTGFIVDRSEQKALEEQLRQSQRLEAVGQLAGGIAHDFNNLLTVIIGCADLIALSGRRPSVPAGGHDPLDALMKATTRAAALTQQLLAFSRRQVLQPRSVDLNEALRGVHSMLRRLVHDNVVIMLNLDPRIEQVQVDPGQLDQVVVNLVVNSADALPKGGTISLETSNVTLTHEDAAQYAYVRPGQYVSLIVRDNGAGMDEATRARVFEPFFTTKPVGKGTGLGLSTVYGIVKQSGGYVWVESLPGSGTTVTVCLPVANRDQAAA
jgi:two-component system cell cycle sensor histidine kinase/response regulator CckA